MALKLSETIQLKNHKQSEQQRDFPAELPSNVTFFKWSGQRNRRVGSVETWPLSMVLSLWLC